MGKNPLEGDRLALPLHAEEVSVERRRVDAGRVRLQICTTRHDHLVDEALARERVEIERVAIGRVVDATPSIRQEGDATVIPVVEEVVVVERRLVLKEEVRFRRVQVTERHRETVSLRTQQATVQRLPVEAAEANLPAAAPAEMQPPTRSRDE